ncbi:REP-associated tyrosine transposase [Baaleninema simplex]|uniref:REP-associated tyrosine transposase n=1 Tax=Baaleninema simplex TaxID=2862350 RepID=UPI000349C1F9|nr:transposase [Baaleninema simplex]
MPNYRRDRTPGATFFITQVTYCRQPWLCRAVARKTLRDAIERVRQKYPFQIDAFVLLPDHFHALWTLPENDGNCSTRMRLIKIHVTRKIGRILTLEIPETRSRYERGERNLWQRRFWEHRIRDERDFQNHFDYIHHNPVKHGLCRNPTDWPYSSIHRFTPTHTP